MFVSFSVQMKIIQMQKQFKNTLFSRSELENNSSFTNKSNLKIQIKFRVSDQKEWQNVLSIII